MDQTANEPKPPSPASDGIRAVIVVSGFLGLLLFVLLCGGMVGKRRNDPGLDRQRRLRQERDAKLHRLEEIVEEGTRPGVTDQEIDRLRDEVRRMPEVPSE